MTPINFRFGSFEMVAISEPDSLTGQPPRCGKPEMFICSITCIVLPDSCAAVEIFSACLSDSTLWIMSKSCTISLILRDCSLPMKCFSRSSGRFGNFSEASFRRFSAIAVMPVRVSISKISSQLLFFVTATTLSFSGKFVSITFVNLIILCRPRLLPL